MVGLCSGYFVISRTTNLRMYLDIYSLGLVYLSDEMKVVRNSRSLLFYHCYDMPLKSCGRENAKTKEVKFECQSSAPYLFFFL